MNTLYSLASKSRVASFESDDDFDVVSLDESVEECIEVDDAESSEEWEPVSASENEPQPSDDVQIELDEGFQDAIEASLEENVFATANASTQTPSDGDLEATEAMVLSSPRRRSARESLKEFYLDRAKQSECKSKEFQHHEPAIEPALVVIAPLRAPERYDIELYERVTREENARQAQLALQSFYAKRDEDKARRAAENRANERFVYQSQSGSMTSSLSWDTTRFVKGQVLSA